MIVHENSIKIHPQECSGNCGFDSMLVMAQGFHLEFGSIAPLLAVASVLKIKKTYKKADYLQVLEFNNVKYWVIDDGNAVTCLLPSEY